MIRPLLIGAAIVLGTASLTGCGSGGASTEAPPITGKVEDWKSMTKDEKIASLKANKSIPAPALVEAIRRVEQGID